MDVATLSAHVAFDIVPFRNTPLEGRARGAGGTNLLRSFIAQRVPNSCAPRKYKCGPVRLRRERACNFRFETVVQPLRHLV